MPVRSASLFYGTAPRTGGGARNTEKLQFAMEITKKMFWTEAMKGGSIIGLVTASLQLVRMSVMPQTWFEWVSLLIFALLLYGFTRRMAGRASARDGFPYSRCMGFVMGMMLFTGIIVGVATALMYNFLVRDAVVEIIDAYMGGVRGLLPRDQFDATYDSLYRAMFNPLLLVIAGVVTYVVQGGLIGLFTSALAQRKPEPFAPAEEDEPKRDGDAA